MASFVATIRRLWDEWELRSLVLISLLIQTILISLGSVRKHRASRTISFLVWSCYLLADWVATLALGVLAKTLLMNNSSDGDNQSGSSSEKDDELKAFWAPFLLLHLGGPDNITAFSLADNELWLRHLVGLLFQAATAIYIFISSLPAEPTLSLLMITILMLIGGIIKYVERTLALVKASRDHFRKSMLTKPDPGPDYEKFMVEYTSKKNAGLDIRIDCDREPESPKQQEIEEENEIELISKAHHFFQIFKRLIVDLILTFHDRDRSQDFFTKTSSDKAYKVIEIELGFLYEVLYTKAPVVRTRIGWILRFTSVSSIIVVSSIFFAFTDKQQYHKIDIAITCVLLSGAIALDFWSLTRLLFSDWTVAWMKMNNFNRFITRIVFKVVSYKGRVLLQPNRSRWSNSMSQYNLINFCIKDHQPFFLGKIMESIHVKDLFDTHWYRTYKEISEELKIYIFEELQKAAVPGSAGSSHSFLHFGTSRGQLALQSRINDQEGHHELANQIRKHNQDDEILEDSIKAEFDESILLWHIATDICYYLDGEKDKSKTVLSDQKKSRDISNYMLYLLVSRPSMLPEGIGQIRFGDTCAEAQRFLRQGGRRETEEQACKRLHEVNTDISPLNVKGDRCKSVLFEASRVAKALLKQAPDDVEKRWTMISLLWLEMLCYAASKCRGYYHAQRLSAGGGELLTVVCFLMVHLGIGKQYRIHRGHAQAKLMVKNDETGILLPDPGPHEKTTTLPLWSRTPSAISFFRKLLQSAVEAGRSHKTG